MVKVFVRAAGRDNCGGCVYRGDGILLLIPGGLVASRPCSLVQCRGARGLQGSAWLVVLWVACTHARVHQSGRRCRRNFNFIFFFFPAICLPDTQFLFTGHCVSPTYYMIVCCRMCALQGFKGPLAVKLSVNNATVTNAAPRRDCSRCPFSRPFVCLVARIVLPAKSTLQLDRPEHTRHSRTRGEK